MFNENIVVSAALLNGATNQVTTINTDQEEVSAVDILNSTGATVYLQIMSESEYQAWLLNGAISGWFIMLNNTPFTWNDLTGLRMKRIVILGTAGHTSALYITVIKGGN